MGRNAAGVLEQAMRFLGACYRCYWFVKCSNRKRKSRGKIQWHMHVQIWFLFLHFKKLGNKLRRGSKLSFWGWISKIDQINPVIILNCASFPLDDIFKTVYTALPWAGCNAWQWTTAFCICKFKVEGFVWYLSEILLIKWFIGTHILLLEM